MRRMLLFLLVVITGLVFIGRLLYLQVFNSSFAVISERNAIKIEYEYPQRGYIYDRNGKLLVSNQPTYDVMVVPREVEAFDTIQFADYLQITKERLKLQLQKARVYSPQLPSVVVSQVSKEDYAYLQEKMRKFPGFYIQKRFLRDYQVHGAANVLGYISEVNPMEIAANKYYQQGDLIGRSGVEKQYEDLLKGKKGVKYFQKDRFSKEIGSYKNGLYDTLAVNGKDLTLSIDMDLQDYGQKLMTGKRGGIVAIEPKSGEILSLITAPSYDPALLVGRDRSKNFTKMWYDTINKPLYDRSLLATYPPGSTFKTIMGAIALQEGIINTDTRISCHHGFSYGRGARMGCHGHASPLSVTPAIANSCNTFFAKSYWRLVDSFETPQEGVDDWRDHVMKFGLGDFLGYDLPTGRAGYIPDSEYYNRAYNYPKYHWSATYILSNGIGQGEVLTTPIQLANMTAAIANRGWYYTPHILKAVDGKLRIDEAYTQKHDTGIDVENLEPIIEGMKGVFDYGTARAMRIKDVVACGKTGTAENYTRINGKRVQLTDHSIFISFAPKDDPKIAIAVFVENGRWGSRYAARIASLMMAKYLDAEVVDQTMEDWILTHDLEDEYAKEYSGTDFEINL